MSLDKIKKTVPSQFIEYTNTMIKNGNLFSINSYDISYQTNDETIYMNDDEMIEFLQNLFNEKINYKQLPEKAIENMRKKGIEPKKQPIEMLLIFITCTKNDVYYYVSIPDNLYVDINKLMEDLDYQIVESTKDTFPRQQFYGSVKCEFPLKYKDTVQQSFFTKFREIGLYQDDDSDDEMEFNLNDL